MAVAYIEYCTTRPMDGSAIADRALYVEALTISGTTATAASAATGEARVVHIQTDDTACYAAVGTTPDPTATTATTATTIRRYIPAGSFRDLPIAVGQSVAVKAVS